MSTYLTAVQVAERWQCHRSTVTALARRGEIAAMRLGTDWRFPLAAVEAYEAAHTTSPTSRSGADDKTTAGSRPLSVPAVAVGTDTASALDQGAVTSVDGFELPADYVPVFPALWGQEPTTTPRAASSAAGHRSRSARSTTRKAADRS